MEKAKHDDIDAKDNGAGNEETTDKNKEDMKELGVVSAGDGGDAFQCISIIGQIEGHYALENNQKATKYDHLIPLLLSLEENEHVKGILFALNTMGGDVEAGLAISEVIASLSKPTVSIVLGGGHSIGVPLAVSAKKSFIVPSATMTIHPVRTSGLVISAPQSFDYLKKMQDRIIRFILRHSHISEDYLRKALQNTSEMANDIGSVLEGEEAVACGLIDEVGGVADAFAALKEMAETTK